jgi:hypothetical protein
MLFDNAMRSSGLVRLAKLVGANRRACGEELPHRCLRRTTVSSTEQIGENVFSHLFEWRRGELEGTSSLIRSSAGGGAMPSLY